MSDLVERMMIAAQHAHPDGDNGTYPFARMTAALRVAADALLGPVTDEEAKDWSRDDWGVRYIYQTGVNELLAARRVHIERKDTPEERVTVLPEHSAFSGQMSVYLDGKWQIMLPPDKAEIYRLGLIANLKQES